MAAQAFCYRDTHELPLSRRSAWAQLTRAELYPTWWSWMRDLEVTGTPLEPGTTFTFRVVAPIPFTMRLVVEVIDSKEAERLEATIHGDLVGTATMSFEEISAESTRATLGWNVEVHKPRVRGAARALRPILQWGQNWAVDSALKGFLRHLDGG